MKRYHLIRVLLVLGLALSLSSLVPAALAGDPSDPYCEPGDPPTGGDPWFDTYGDDDDGSEGDPGDAGDGLGYDGRYTLVWGDLEAVGVDETGSSRLEYLLMLVKLMQLAP